MPDGALHVHTLDPGEIIHYAASLGTVHSMNIRNMDKQYQDFLARCRKKKHRRRRSKP